MGVIAVAQFTIRDASDITVSAIAPSSPILDELWLDTSVTPNQLRRWTGEEWEIVNDSADIIEAVEEAINNISVGARNLLSDTGETPISITENTSLGEIDLRNYAAGWSGWVTYRVKLSPSNGAWKLRLRCAATNDNAMLGSAVLGAFYIGEQSGDETIIDSETYTSETWATIVTQLPSANYIVEPQIVCTGESGTTQYSYPKFELGNIPTQWTPSPEDVDGKIDDVSVDVQNLELKYSVQFEVKDKEISSLVGATDNLRTYYTELNQATTGLTATVAQHGASIDTLVTSVSVETDGLHLKQPNSSGYEAFLTSDELAFRDVDDPTKIAASFGAQGGYVDRLRSNEKLSVGRETNGWYDMIVLDNGTADKWRNGTNPVTPKPMFTQQPVNSADCVKFMVVAENVTGYKWQRRYKGTGTFADLTGANAAIYETSNEDAAYEYEYRCSLDDGAVYSRAVIPYRTNSTYPEIIAAPGNRSIQSGNSTKLTVLVNQSDCTYQWQTYANSNWTDVSDGTTASLTVSPSSTTVYRCKIESSGNYVVTTACEVEVIS